MFRVDLDFIRGTIRMQLKRHQVYVKALAPRECAAKALAYLRQHHAEKIQGHELAAAWIVTTPGIEVPGLRIRRAPSMTRSKVTHY
jgi:hypothetical protein